jgi:hypothetical protein
MRAVAAVALLAACAATPPAGNDNVTVVWNRVEEPHRMCEALSGRKHFFNILGCSQWSGSVCSIYAPAPRSERDVQRFATLGHELMHCFDGNWHDPWGRMNSAPSHVK